MKALKESTQKHSDKVGDPGKFKDITSAFEVFSKSQKRYLYYKHGDEGLEEGSPGDSGGDFEIFLLSLTVATEKAKLSRRESNLLSTK